MDPNSHVINREQNDEQVVEDDDESLILTRTSEQPKRYFLECALVLLFFGNNLIQTLLTNQMLKQACLQFHNNITICDNLNQNESDSTSKEIEKEIQPFIANINMVTSLIHTVIPAILSVFLGPFSDTYGRKPILNFTFTGYALTLIAFASVCFYSEYIHPISPWIYALCYIPETLFGGWPSLLSATLCYITDITEETKRSFRLLIIEIIIFIGVLVGNLLCSIILTATNPFTVFAISATCGIFATFVIIFLVEESVNAPRQATLSEKLMDLLSSSYVVDMVKTCFKRRPFKERRILLSLIAILMLTVFTFSGNITIGYLFERLKFNWTLKDHNYYNSYNIIITIIGSVIGFGILKKWLKFSDMTLTCIALLSGFADSFLKAFAVHPMDFYLISSFTLFRILSSPMCRSLISNIIPQNEIGKIFSITTSFEALSDLVAAPLYTHVYNVTYTTFPGAFFLITAGVFIINIGLAFYTIAMKRIRETLINPYIMIEEN